MQGKKVLLRASGAVALALALVLVGCSSDDSADKAGSSDSGSEVASSGSSSDFAAEVAKRGEPKVGKADTPSELKITDDVLGSGKAAQSGDTVTVQYVGAAATTGEVFESSWSGDPVTFPLDRVIQGWSQGLVGMKEGGRRTLVIPADLAYGNSGPAPGDALVFTIDLIKVA